MSLKLNKLVTYLVVNTSHPHLLSCCHCQGYIFEILTALDNILSNPKINSVDIHKKAILNTCVYSQTDPSSMPMGGQIIEQTVHNERGSDAWA